MSHVPSPETASFAHTLSLAVVEQVMRCGNELELACAMAEAPAGSPQAAGLLGQFMTTHPHTCLVAGSPLNVWAAGGTVIDPHWRAGYPPAPGSAYAHLSFLDELYPGRQDEDDLSRLLDLQAQVVIDMAA